MLSYAYKIPGVIKYGPVALSLLKSLGLSKFSDMFIKHTFFKQFCGGETLEEVNPVIVSLKKRGIGTILDLAVENKINPGIFNLIRDTIDYTPQGNFVALKMSALIPENALTQQDFKVITQVLPCIHGLCQYAKKRNVKLMFDAEHSVIQPAIDDIVIDLCKIYNVNEVTIYHTYQLYLKDSHSRLIKDLENARKQNYKIGIKLVRGAYMNSEQRDLIHDTIQNTHENYNNLVEYLIRKKESSTVLATHNEESIQKAINLIKRHKLPKHSVGFAQLFGMKNELTCSLASSGYNVYKYIPYGSVSIAMPYLIRRAQENSDILI